LYVSCSGIHVTTVNGEPVTANVLGPFGPPRLIAQLELTYPNGRKQVVATDGAGWDTSAADLSGWKSAVVTAKPAAGTALTGRQMPAVQIVETGTVITMRPGEKLKNGLIDQSTTGTPIYDTYTARLRVVTPGVYGIAARQSYGLIGPVQLVAYGRAAAIG
jgi:hypothetical protein